MFERLLVLARRAKGDSLQPVHYSVLSYLSRCNRYSDTLTALVAYLGATKGTVSETVRALEGYGLLQRRADAKDGRVSHLLLTKAGYTALAEQGKNSWRGALAKMPIEQQERISAALTELLVAMQKHNDNRAFGACYSCRHFQNSGTQSHCGLTNEPLSTPDSLRICYEHAQ